MAGAYGKGVHELTGDDFENLLAFRTGLRRFLHWSQTQARAVGLTPAQHQLLVAIKGHPGPQGPTIGDLAGYLLLRHHSAVELVDRAAAAGLVERRSDAEDRRVTRVGLTADGEARLNKLATAHLDELRNLAPVLDQLVAGWTGCGEVRAGAPVPAPPGRAGQGLRAANRLCQDCATFKQTFKELRASGKPAPSARTAQPRRRPRLP